MGPASWVTTNKDNPEERGVDLPDSVVISEEGPREGFQIEPGPIATADKIALIDALSACGLRRIQVGSFVNPKQVPGWADAEAVMEGFAAREGVEYSAVWFNAAGMQRALAFKGKLTVAGFISLSASEPFAIRNLNRDRAGQIEAMRQYVRVHREAGVPIRQDHRDGRLRLQLCRRRLAGKVVETVADARAIAREAGVEVQDVTLADSMGWATPGASRTPSAPFGIASTICGSRFISTTRAGRASPAPMRACGSG
jgi:hydroxymethylglutaryl-CoA lyase